jgi:hypothetical protein
MQQVIEPHFCPATDASGDASRELLRAIARARRS